MSVRLPDLHPEISAVRAVVTTRWKGTAYRSHVIQSLESYYVDTALDNDADTWTIDIGDPDGTYLPLIRRDNEVRVQLFGVGREGVSYILTGISDNIDYTAGSWTLTGRDLSSLATDSTAMPHRYSKARAWSIVKSQAHQLGFQHTQLARTGIVRKSQYTDGSESYWDFWYRLYRQEKMWLWTLPNGWLVGGKLNYSDDPDYFLGDARDKDGDHILAQLIPVIDESLHKSTQTRLGEVVIFGTHGKDGFSVTVDDPTVSHWHKRPRKIMLDTTSRTTQAARRAAWEEIFEGKVGSVEYKITVPDPGYVIQQNRVARLYLKDIGLFGNYFVVGSRIQGGPDGFVQEVRLRELELAVSRRVPAAPKLATGQPNAASGTLGKALESTGAVPTGWGDYFIKAAKRYHGIMNYQLFLACLLGICYCETGFQNERQNGGPGGDHHHWHPFVPSYQKPIPEKWPPGVYHPPWLPGIEQTVTNDKQKWEQMFVNEPGSYGITTHSPWGGGSGRDAGQGGVGPMQLTSLGMKQAADDLLKPGQHNQFTGGRWNPEHNIMIGARTLAYSVTGVKAINDSMIWLAVDAYNRGVAGALAYFNLENRTGPYAQEVRRAVESNPGFLADVKTAVSSKEVHDSSGTGKGFTNPFPDGWIPNRLDMGWDGTITRRIVAPFDCTVIYAGVMHGWRGSGGVIIRSDKKLPFATNCLYFAEGITPTVASGDKVRAGHQIARPARSPYNGIIGNIEWGVAADGPNGRQTDPLAESGIANRKQMVLQFVDWAKATLDVKGVPTDVSRAGYA